LNWSDEKYKFTLGLGALALVGMLAELARPALPAWVAMAVALTPLILFVFLHPGELPDGVIRAAHVAASVWYLAAAAVILNEGLRRPDFPRAWAFWAFLLLPGRSPARSCSGGWPGGDTSRWRRARVGRTAPTWRNARMGKLFAEIDDGLREFIARQHVFFVATAPLAPGGHVNVSPKGLDTFRVLGPTTVAYLDLTGSGVETVAHLRENGRLTLMFCALSGAPRILRLYGRGQAVETGDADWDRLRGAFPHFDGARSVVVLEVERIADSCGFGVPLFDYHGERPQLPAWADRTGPAGVARYQAEKNRRSIDDLPGLRGV
jgi:hypothetical protein